MIVHKDAEDFNELDRKIEEEARKRTDSVLVCPQCNSTNVTYQCKECGYVGAFIIERDKE